MPCNKKATFTCALVSALVLILAPVRQIQGFPNGAPPTACATMTPGHGVDGQQSASPFMTQLLDGEIVLMDGTVRLELRPQNGVNSFKGFLVMAFDKADESKPIGTFKQPIDGKVIDCSAGVMNAVTHHSSDEKHFVTVHWTPPKDYVGLVSFRTTYLTNGTVFWINTPAAHPVRVIDPISATLPTFTETQPSTTWLSTDTRYSEMATSDGNESIATTTEETMFNVTEDGYNSTDFFTTDETTAHVTTGMTSTTKPSGSGPSSEFRLDFKVLLASMAFWAVLLLRDKHLLLITV
ncbi:putative defense protein Hdd11 isoform X1 [Daphnia carinata]|uniref:putative defense protein Hdd11 isoform X1 n=1 Tax=Daphnia carinata TaxID=120202 RepID=UPI0028692C66|nr:putative defense protein Hdd11 isoform X1 [Daphnia carinata]